MGQGSYYDKYRYYGGGNNTHMIYVDGESHRIKKKISRISCETIKIKLVLYTNVMNKNISLVKGTHDLYR